MTDSKALQVWALSTAEFFERYEQIDDPEHANDALRLRFRFDRESFCRYCWPGHRFALPFNAFHRSLFKREEHGDWRSRIRTVRDSVAGPRGYAKSTISSFAQVVHDVVYDMEAFVVITSTGQSLSHRLAKDIKAAFEDEESPLWRLYGPFKITGPTSEFYISVQGRPTICILASSAGTAIRGAKHATRGIRPTKVLIDDGEHPDRVRNPEQRALWWDWLTKDVLKLGPREGGTVYNLRGTILHPDSGLARTQNHPGWDSECWRAIISWPERSDLWEQCGEIWKDLTNPDRRDDAEAFYEEWEEEMDEGVEVLDPAAETIFDLYEQIWGEGLGAFLQEKQNDPRDPTTAIFDSSTFARCKLLEGRHGLEIEARGGRRIPLADCKRKIIRWDPAMGGPTGDFAGLAAVFRDQYGYAFVMGVWLRKAKPSAQLAAFWAMSEQWGIRRGSLESNGFQELVAEPFERERKARKEAGKWWQVTVNEEGSTGNKEARIAAMEPDITNGWIQFGPGMPPELFHQFDSFPGATHDDGPDVIEGAWSRLGGTAAGMNQTRRLQ